MSEIKWIKLAVDLFDNEKILLIEEISGSDEIIIIWIKLILLAGKKNADGAIFFKENIPYTPEMLSKIFRKKIGIVRVSLKTFINFEMIYIENEIIFIKNWDKYQNVDGMNKIREQNRIRQQKRREQKKLTDNSHDSHVTCHVTDRDNVTLCHDQKQDNVTLRHVTDLDLDIRSKINTKKEYIVKCKEIIDYLNLKANKNFKHIDNNFNLIIPRLKDLFTVDDLKSVIDKKCKTWLNDPEMNMYLRPLTLFQKSKIEGYLNEQEIISNPVQQNQKVPFHQQRDLDKDQAANDKIESDNRANEARRQEEQETLRQQREFEESGGIF